ncbi:hypothetical protein ACQ46_gp293 [Citrobacter phage Moon]|uniref:Uncharacterized protein n=1 Tax=Citrobacter phage Moon TaxID=1540095 RepID=A0A0A0YQ87_9CAUD|nr:hypothetical protein ACQ46_gp293 [Citrobacter phage Moon]AIX12131.1 hypothetical protein CPT_Moon160 [Citrobacter phage Moon]
MKSYKEFLMETEALLESTLPDYTIVKSFNVKNGYVIKFPIASVKPGADMSNDAGISVKVNVQFINYNSAKKSYDAKMTFSGGEKVVKNIKLDYDESAESVKKRFGDKLVKSIMVHPTFKRDFTELYK